MALIKLDELFFPLLLDLQPLRGLWTYRAAHLSKQWLTLEFESVFYGLIYLGSSLGHSNVELSSKWSDFRTRLWTSSLGCHVIYPDVPASSLSVRAASVNLSSSTPSFATPDAASHHLNLSDFNVALYPAHDWPSWWPPLRNPIRCLTSAEGLPSAKAILFLLAAL
ncbi:hypothetical protein Nepgr_015195 [Nepenthes gracilis]|uniref:Uncharacterized protein n=1 Tax=Nepenthes gracilis TaxID=150966 RepID=A0AAD3SMG4_NEPGR|nr:hypothetical protein Nepgr_015195 [Nepenthes gracilis]